MKRDEIRSPFRALLAGGVLFLLAIPPAAANIIWSTGNQQYDNVNIAAATDALSVQGEIGSNSNIFMTFENMIGPDGSTQITMHCAHGVAFCENVADANGPVTHGFSGLTLMSQGGYGWTAGDLALDQLNGITNPTYNMVFTGHDQFGNTIVDSLLSLDLQGQSQFQFTTSGGEIVTQIDIMVGDPTTNLLADIKQVSLEPHSIPEPDTLALLGVSIVALGFLRRRNRRQSRSV